MSEQVERLIEQVKQLTAINEDLQQIDQELRDQEERNSFSIARLERRQLELITANTSLTTVNNELKQANTSLTTVNNELKQANTYQKVLIKKLMGV